MGINCWTLAAGSTDSTGRNVGCALKFHFMRSAHFSFVAPDSWGRRSCSSTYLVTYGWILRYLWQVRLIEYKPVLVLLSKCEAWASRRLRCMLWTEKVNLRSLGFHVHWWIPYDSMRDPPCILFFSLPTFIHLVTFHAGPIVCFRTLRNRTWDFLRICLGAVPRTALGIRFSLASRSLCLFHSAKFFQFTWLDSCQYIPGKIMQSMQLHGLSKSWFYNSINLKTCGRNAQLVFVTACLH